MKHPYQKIGGWLRVMQVCVIAFTAILLLSVVSSIRLFAADKDGITFASTLSSAALYLLATIPLWQLLRRNPKFLRNYHLAVLLVLALDCIKNFILRWNELVLLFNEARSSAGSGFVAFLLFALSLLLVLLVNAVLLVPLWVYFLRSVRVRTYLGTEAYFQTALTKKMKKLPQPAVPDGDEAAQAEDNGEGEE